MEKGLLMVYTGAGKGKTTAALGTAFRALGHGYRVCIIQFIKGSWTSGEKMLAERFEDLLEFHVMGRGFTRKSEDPEQDIALARKAWSLAMEKIESRAYRLVILDELTYPISYGMLEEAEVVDFLKNRSKDVDILVTGRNASERLTEAADTVTEMTAVKHHFASGVKARKGIEF